MRLMWGNPKSSDEDLDDAADLDEYIFSRRNCVFFNYDVTSRSSNEFIRKVYSVLDGETETPFFEKAKELVIQINSPGGDAHEVFKMIDFLAMLKRAKHLGKVTTVVNGLACSAATILSMSGDERLITKNSYMMIHEISGIVGGVQTHLKSQYEIFNEMHGRIIDFYATRSSMEKEEVKDILMKEGWFNAPGAKKLGLVDKII